MLGLYIEIRQIPLDFPWVRAKGKGTEHTISTLWFIFLLGCLFFFFSFFLPALHAPSNSTYNNSPGCLR